MQQIYNKVRLLPVVSPARLAGALRNPTGDLFAQALRKSQEYERIRSAAKTPARDVAELATVVMPSITADMTTVKQDDTQQNIYRIVEYQFTGDIVLGVEGAVMAHIQKYDALPSGLVIHSSRLAELAQKCARLKAVNILASPIAVYPYLLGGRAVKIPTYTSTNISMFLSIPPSAGAIYTIN